jgi:hypothetical protein
MGTLPDDQKEVGDLVVTHLRSTLSGTAYAVSK